MKYNKYCSNKYSNRYNADKEVFTSNGHNETCELSMKESSCSYHEECPREVAVTPKCGEKPEPTCPCQPIVECDNCVEPCKCCNGVQCDFNSGKVEYIRTLVKRLFAEEKTETCPAIEEITVVQGSTATEITLDVIPCNCNCECPAVDATSKFTVKCVQVEATNVTLGTPEMKLNGKVVNITKNSVTGCYEGIITKDMLRCIGTCKAEKGELCVRAEGWTFDGVITIRGCVVTAGQGCEFILTLKPIVPIEFSDNTVFYMGDICVTDGDVKLCFNPKFCFLADSITSDGTGITVAGNLKMNVESQVSIFKDQEVCIQAVVVQ